MAEEETTKIISPEVASLLQQHRVLRLINDDEELNRDAVDEQGNTALHLICMPREIGRNSDTDHAFKVVLELDPNVHVCNVFGWSPLMLAVLLMPNNIVSMLIAHDQSASTKEHASNTYSKALLVAAAYGKPDTVAALMKAGAAVTTIEKIRPEEKHQNFLKSHQLLLSQIDGLLGHYPEFDREIAQMQNLTEDELTHLSKSKDEATRKFVTLNPSTPSKTLFKLAPEFPRAFYKNPAFDWLLLEQPDLLFEMRNGVLKHILSLSDCPQSFLEWAARNGSNSEKLTVARREKISPEILQTIADTSDGRVAAVAVALHPDSSAEALMNVCFQDEAADRLIAMHPNASLEVLKKLTDSKDELVKKHLLSNPNTDKAIVNKLHDPRVFVHKLR
jgi:DNA-binding NarL/FixJ family response regulator